MYIWGKGPVAGRVGSDFLSAIAGRVHENWPVDNSDAFTMAIY